ncbi:hypothetical protein XM75_c11854 [Vibrio vulnificus]|nr:hypothetical protein [Vibrio vulnificus]OQK50277.1 hypothetical protein XM75_c11854 [Vibrio vulnificus]
MEKEKLYKEISRYIQSLNRTKRDYLIYLCKLHDYFDSNNLDGNSIGITTELSKRIVNDKKHLSGDEIISEIENLFTNCINTEEIDFILNDDIATMFCYIHLMNNSVFSESGDMIYLNDRHTMKEKPLRFSKFSNTHEMKSIVTMRRDFINFINLMECNYRRKHEYLSFLNSEYSKHLENLNLSWIKRNDRNQVEWIHGYITKTTGKNGKKNEFYKYIPNRPKLFETGEYGFIFLPAMLYALPLNIAEKKLFLINVKKAWSQSKYREKIKKEKKKTLNLVVDQSVVNNLKQLSVEFDLPVNQLVSFMAERWLANVNEIKEAIKKEKLNKIDLIERLMQYGEH